MTSANETQPPLQSSPADEINHHTVIGVVDPGESTVPACCRVVAPAIRSRLVERATPVETLSARPSRKLSCSVCLATRSVWERMTGDTALRDDDR